MDVLDQGTGLEVLGAEECLRLLATQFIGRIGLVVDDEPLVIPVNYALDGTSVVFRATPGSRFDRVVRDARVCFEVDHADPAYHTGWSVLGRGVVESVLDPADIARLQRLHLRPWARGERPSFLRLRLDHLTGRRIVQVGRVVDPVIQLSDTTVSVFWG